MFGLRIRGVSWCDADKSRFTSHQAAFSEFVKYFLALEFPFTFDLIDHVPI